MKNKSGSQQDNRSQNAQYYPNEPFTGEPVFKETGGANGSTVCGFWCHEVPDGRELLCDELEPQWAAHVAIQDALEDGVDVVAFLKSVDKPGWVAFEVTSCGFACGPVSSTTWTVLDLNCSAE